MTAAARSGSALRAGGFATRIDRYIAWRILGTFGNFLAIIFALMMLEQFPRLVDLVGRSGDMAHLLGKSMLALVPEYAGFGVLFGLYFGVALTVRRLNLQRELPAFEAIGMSPRRWMRWPMLVALLCALLLLLTQGWLKPLGEATLIKIKDDMARGLFGLVIDSGQFIDLGDGARLRFEQIDSEHGMMQGIFLDLPGKTVAARSGIAQVKPDGTVQLEFHDGQVMLRGASGGTSITQFTRLHESGFAMAGAKQLTVRPYDRFKSISLPRLVASPDPVAQAVAGGRLLWPLFALLAPLLGMILGKPPQRGEGFFGVLTGGLLLVLFIRIAVFVEGSEGDQPWLVAGLAAVACCALVGGLLAAERRLGRGFVDAYVGRVVKAGLKLVVKERALHRRFPSADPARKPG